MNVSATAYDLGRDDHSAVHYTSQMDGITYSSSSRDACHKPTEWMMFNELRLAGEMIRELRAEIEALKSSTPSLSNGGA